MPSSASEQAIFALNSRYKVNRRPFKIALKLLKSCIHPVLTYGSVVRGSFESSDYDR